MLSAAPNKTRDLRLDFFRGLALICIFIDHLPGNYLAQFTFQNFGYADAAEVFVLIAGLTSALAFGAVWRKRGGLAGLRAIFARSARLYSYHLAVAALALMAAFTLFSTYADRAMLSAFGIEPVFDAPGEALAGLLTLTYLPSYMDILPLYVVLIASLALILPLQRLHYALPLLPSLSLYIAAQQFGWNLPNFLNSTVWFFNPAAWQLLFVIGAVMGAMLRDGISPPRWLRPALTGGATAFVLFTLIHAAPWTQIPALADLRLITLPLPSYEDKMNLSVWRLVDILAKAWLAGVLIAPAGRLMNSFFARAARLLGRNSLDVFAMSTVLAIAAGLYAKAAGNSVEFVTFANIAGLSAMFALAAALETGLAPVVLAVRSAARKTQPGVLRLLGFRRQTA